MYLYSAGFFQTPAGATVIEQVQEQMTKIIETLFPPKSINITLEGFTDEVKHEAKGKEPEAETPGFAIYVDTDLYKITEEDGKFYIRQIEEPNPSLPIIEMVIEELPDISPEIASEKIKGEMENEWETNSETQKDSNPIRLNYSVFSGNDNHIYSYSTAVRNP